MASFEKHRERFEEWLRDHAGILHHVARAFAEREDREDLMQELMLALWKSIPAFREESKVSTFLYRVTHNAAMTWRRKGRLHTRKIEAFRREPAPQDGDAGNPSGADPAGDSGERLSRLYAEIRRLPALDRSLILLSLDGMSYSAMAALHGLSESNVGARLTRARQKLTSALKNKQNDE